MDGVGRFFIYLLIAPTNKISDKKCGTCLVQTCLLSNCEPLLLFITYEMRTSNKVT